MVYFASAVVGLLYRCGSLFVLQVGRCFTGEGMVCLAGEVVYLSYK